MTEAATRVALVEDHALLAESMYVALSMRGLEVVNVLTTPATTKAADLLDSIVDARPDVVLLDLDLGHAGDGAALVEPLTRGGCPVVVITGSRERARWGECLAHGARTVLAKSAPLHEIIAAVRRVVEGVPAISQPERSELIRRWHQRRASEHSVRSRFHQLTRRETEVLVELIGGKLVRDIARDGFVSEATVRTQIKSILAKLGVSSQIAAVAFARQAGWGPAA